RSFSYLSVLLPRALSSALFPYTTLFRSKRRRIYLAEKEADVPKVGAVEFKITIPVPPQPTRSHKSWDSAKAIAWVPARAIAARTDRKSTRLNSSHVAISYAVFCLKKKK